MITKKDIPLELFKIIEPIALDNLDLVKIKKTENTFYHFIETDEKSNNYFRIYIDGSKIINNYNAPLYVIESKPANTISSKNAFGQIKLEEIKEKFYQWINIIREIEESNSIHDDIFIKEYANYYYNEIKIIDKDADISPYNPKQQEAIIKVLLFLSEKINETSNELENSVKIELIDEIKTIESNLSTSTKTQFLKKFSKLFGRIYKNNPKITKQIFELTKEFYINKGIEKVNDVVNFLIDLI